MLGPARAAAVLLLAFVGSSNVSARGVPTVPKPLVQDASLAKPNWIFDRKFLYKKDQKMNGPRRVDARPNQTFEIPTSGEKGFWEVEVRGDGRGPADVWVLSVPQDEEQETIISYEIAMTRGRFQPASVRFAPEGTIYLIDRKASASNEPGRKAKMKIGSFKVDMRTLPPLIDRAFSSYNR